MAGPQRVEPARVHRVPDLAGLAADAKLRFSTDAEPGIVRRRAGRGFHYVGPDGAPIRDAAMLARIRALAIPPAWHDVWICRDAAGLKGSISRFVAWRTGSIHSPLPERNSMLFSLLYFLVGRVLGAGGRLADEKDIELLVLRHQVKVLQRQVKRPRLHRLDRVLLAAASRALTRSSWSSFVVGPETLLRWHRELVKKKWTYRRTGHPGRPPIEPEVRDLIVRLGRENPRWGYQRIRGEVLKLDIRISATTVGLGAPTRRSQSREAGRRRARPGGREALAPRQVRLATFQRLDRRPRSCSRSSDRAG